MLCKVFLTVIPNFQYWKEKNDSTDKKLFYIEKFMVHRFLFGTEKEEEQLDKHLVYYSDFTTYCDT